MEGPVMIPLILIAMASAPQPAVVRLADCRPGLVLMAYETQATDRQRREKPRKVPRAARPCITLASA
jgi:hypothetical protein